MQAKKRDERPKLMRMHTNEKLVFLKEDSKKAARSALGDFRKRTQSSISLYEPLNIRQSLAKLSDLLKPSLETTLPHEENKEAKEIAPAEGDALRKSLTDSRTSLDADRPQRGGDSLLEGSKEEREKARGLSHEPSRDWRSGFRPLVHRAGRFEGKEEKAI